jgi:integrase
MASLRKRGKVWYYRYTDAEGVKREAKGCPDKRATEEMARAAEAEAARIKAGLIDPRTIRYQDEGRRPLAEHLAEWHTSLLAKGDTEKHAHMVRAHVARLITLARAERASDLTSSAVQGALKALRDSGRSLQTCNHALRAIKGFSRWLHRDTRTPEDTLAHLQGFNVKTDRRHDRGVLTKEEFDALIRTTRPAAAFRGLSGEDRAILYLVASYTGLRASELASLTPSGFDLDTDHPTVRVHAAYTKNGQEAVLPIRPDLASMLRSYLAGMESDTPVWPGTWVERSSHMLQKDLERAGVAYRDDDGRYRDFHSLRHRFGTELAMANVPPKVAQTLMRHSTITLTMDRYSHAGLFDVAGSLDKLPPLPSPGSDSEVESMRATGTDVEPISERLAHYLPTGGDVSGRNLSDADVKTESDPGMTRGCNSQEFTGLDAVGRDLTAHDGNTPERIRTSNLRFRRRTRQPRIFDGTLDASRILPRSLPFASTILPAHSFTGIHSIPGRSAVGIR